MKLLGLQDDPARTLRWPAGAPYRLRLRVANADGSAQSLDDRGLVMSIWSPAGEAAHCIGTIDSDDDGDFALFAFDGDVSSERKGLRGFRWQIGEGFDGPMVAPMLEGPVSFAASAPLVTASENDPSSLDDASWTPAAETLVVLGGPKGVKGDTGDQGPQGDPGDNIDDETVAPDKTWSSERIDHEIGLISGGGGGAIDDTTPRLDAAYSSSKVVSLLESKAPLASPALTGTPTAPTATAGTNSTQLANTAFVTQAVSALVGGAPGALDTLNELAAALGDDASFATTVTNALAAKQGLSDRLTFLTGASAATASAIRTRLGIGTVSDAEFGLKAGLDPWQPMSGGGQLYDLTTTDAELTRIQGGCTDGTWVYWVAHDSTKIARVLASDPDTVEVLDLEGVNAGFFGPLGCVSDGRRIYVTGHGDSTTIACIDPLDFTPGGVTFFDFGAAVGLPGCPAPPPDGIANGMVFDGRYLLMMALSGPTPSPVYTPYVVRVDTHDLTTAGVVWTSLDRPADLRHALMSIATDGQYAYALTHKLDGLDATPITQNVYLITRMLISTMTLVDETVIGSPTPISGSGVASMALLYDGRYLWTSPTAGIPMQIIDTLNWPASQSFDLSAADADLVGLANGASTWTSYARGRYGWFAPNYKGTLLRVDLQRPGVYATCDLSRTDPDAATSNYVSMVAVGPYLFLASGKPGIGKMIRMQVDL